jgi:hypothetical protein
MIVYKVKWKSYIADLYIPENASGNVSVIVPGLPKSTNVEKIVRAVLLTGSAILYPNYSGTFDSGGIFDGLQSIKDVQEFIEWAQQPEVTEIYFNKNIKLNTNGQVFLIGMSFGAITSLLACNIKVDKLILLSPALLFNQEEIREIVDFDFKNQMSSLVSLLKNAFPFTYRIKSYDSLQKFLYGKIDILNRKNIENTLGRLQQKTLVIHGKLDKSVPIQISYELKKNTNNKLVEWKFFMVGHSTSSYKKRALDALSYFIKN